MTRRYEDWTHVRVNGDRHAAAPYLGEGRKLLGAVMEEAARNGLGVHALHRKLEDGTVIVAEKHGDIPRITITLAPEPPTIPPPLVRDDFVVWARTTELPDGIDEARPQQILRPAWTTFFNSSDVDGFDEFPGDKGTYAGMFPQGLLLAGNIDWVSAATGERLSWYGPSSRYWYDDWREPRAQYGKHVFHLGQALLDVDAYCAGLAEPFNERWVLGAAMTRTSLLVVMADLPPFINWPDPPATAVNSPDSWSTPSVPLDSVSLVLRRFVLVHDESLPAPMQYRIVGDSHDDLWAGTVVRGASPWHFDVAAERVVTHVPPAGLELTQRGETVVLPSQSHQRLVLEIGGNSATLHTREVTLPAGPYAGDDAIVAEDGEHALRLVRKERAGFDAALFYRMGGHDYLAMSVTEAPAVLEYERRQILWADLRAGVLLLAVDSIHANGYDFDRKFLLCANGNETELWSHTQPNAGSIALYDVVRTILRITNTRDTAPLAWAHLNAFGYLTVDNEYGMVVGGWLGVHNGQGSLLHAHYWIPFQKADVVGQTVFKSSLTPPGPWTNGELKADLARNTGANTQTDSLGHTTFPGFASYEGYSILSYAANSPHWPYSTGQRVVLNYITGSTLADATGVAGETVTENGVAANDARYHPVWLLGARRQT